MTNHPGAASRLLVAAAVAGGGIALLPQHSAAAPATTAFQFTGDEQTYTVPAHIFALDVVVVGASGGDGDAHNAARGGAGAQVTATLSVSPGDVLYVEVGGQGGGAGPAGTHTGGYNGGGAANSGVGDGTETGGAGGGGASDIRACSVTSVTCDGANDSISSRLVIAGGGGGAGDNGVHGGSLIDGAAGGAAGTDGSAGSAVPDQAGGEGGGNPGLKGTNVSGGDGGALVHYNPAYLIQIDGQPGGAGSFGQGGAASSLDNGGGGGGGRYGGGAASGGAADGAAGNPQTLRGAGGGGGGGSSAGGSMTAGPGTPNGSVTITTVPTPLPTVVLTSLAAASSSTAKVAGTVNANAFSVSSCTVFYGTTTKLGSKTPCAQPASTIAGASATPVSATLTGLKPATTYHVQIGAVGDGGAGFSAIGHVTTRVGKPTVAHWKAKQIGTTSVTLQAKVKPGGAKTSVMFSYGPTKKYGSTSTSKRAKPAKPATLVKVVVKHLRPGKKYHARVTATNSVGSAKGKDFTFSTKR